MRFTVQRRRHIHDARLLSAVMYRLTGVVGGAGPRLGAASAQSRAPHAPRVVGPTHLGGGSGRRGGGAGDQVGQRGRVGRRRERVQS